MKQERTQFTNNVQLDGNCVLKKVHFGDIQVRLMRAAHALSSQSHSFYVPKVLDYDDRTETMKLEYLPDIVPLKQYFAEQKQVARILYCAGDALANCHDGLRLTEKDRVNALMPWTGISRDQVVLHGDFNMINLCYSLQLDKLVILDWETSPALPFQCNWGSRYLDIVQFIRSLLLQQASLAQSFLQFRKRVRIFLTAYQQASGICLDMRRLRHRLFDYNVAVFRKQISQSKYLSGLWSVLGHGVFRTHLKKMNIKQLANFPSHDGLSGQITGGING